MWRRGRFYWDVVRKKNYNVVGLTRVKSCEIIHRRKGKVSLRKVNFKQGGSHGRT